MDQVLLSTFVRSNRLDHCKLPLFGRSRRGGHVGKFTNRSPKITALSPCYGVDVAGSKVHTCFREFEA